MAIASTPRRPTPQDPAPRRSARRSARPATCSAQHARAEQAEKEPPGRRARAREGGERLLGAPTRGAGRGRGRRRPTSPRRRLHEGRRDSMKPRSPAIEPPTIDGLPPEALESYNGGVENARKAGRLKVENLVQTARRDDGQRQFGTALDLAGKTAGVAGADIEAVNRDAARERAVLYRRLRPRSLRHRQGDRRSHRCQLDEPGGTAREPRQRRSRGAAPGVARRHRRGRLLCRQARRRQAQRARRAHRQPHRGAREQSRAQGRQDRRARRKSARRDG